MRKLTLDMDELEVQSFEMGRAAALSGTVQGMDGNSAGCDSVRICPPNDPSYDPCGETYSPCGDTSDPVCTASSGFTACTCVGTTGC
jgi:hypothetical protein